MPTDTFTALGTVDHGRLTLRDPDTFREAMRHVPDGEVVVSKPLILVNAAGEIIAERLVVRSTTELTPEAFSEYVDRCALCAAETFHFVLPERPGREVAA